MSILLYTRRGCHLCEQAEDWFAIWADATVMTQVDVDGCPALCREFGHRVPVVVRAADGRVLLEGRFDESDVARLVGQTATGPASGPADRGR